MSDDGRSAQGIDPLSCSAIVLSSVPLRGLCEFEVKLLYASMFRGNFMFGIVCSEKAGTSINSTHFPIIATKFDNCCVWDRNTISIRENGRTVKRQRYQYDLNYLRKGNTVGLQITKEGILSFYLNGSCKGVAMKGVYDKSNMEVYAVVDHYGGGDSTEIVRAGK